MDVTLVEKPITRDELKTAAQQLYGDMIKAVVDIEKGVMALGGELHADEEAFLLERNSSQQNLWGINLYPDRDLPQMIEFDSMINIRPRQNNRSRSVDDATIRERIVAVVTRLVQ
ncbi:MAG: DUF5674 family protein [bacterium]